MDENQAAIAEGLRRASLIAGGEVPVITALSGGVSCDVFRVETSARKLCAKRALPRLRVESVWEAPVDGCARPKSSLACGSEVDSRLLRPWHSSGAVARRQSRVGSARPFCSCCIARNSLKHGEHSTMCR